MKNSPSEKDLKLLNKVVTTLTKKYDIDKIILFGSRARGTHTETSDYDLLVLLEFDTLSYRKAAELMQHLQENEIKEDIQLLARTSEMYKSDGLLKHNIDAEGVELYDRGNHSIT
jgi:predicted nucleotidyltransferase